MFNTFLHQFQHCKRWKQTNKQTTIAIAAAKLLLHPNQNEEGLGSDNHKVHIITRVGNDAFAESIMKNFDDANISYDPETIRCTDSHTGVAPIVVDQKTGDNMIIVIPGTVGLFFFDSFLLLFDFFF